MAYGRRPVIAYARGGPAFSHRAHNLIISSNYRNKILAVLFATTVYTAYLYKSGGARNFLSTTSSSMLMTKARHLQVATWNVAAINNNPFEYWITYKDDPGYEKLMVEIEQFIESPGGEKDVLVPQVFTPNMFEQLEKRMSQTAGWQSVKSYWEDDFSKRHIIKDFMMDPLLGSKRLASMPDRITNTIFTADGKAVFRPTVINMYEDDLGSQEKWWAAWEKFMFDTSVKIQDKDGTVKDMTIYSMLKPIKKAKYPDITEQEEADSLPLQTLCGAIFDAILVHMMNTVSTPDKWQPLKRTMVENLNKKKVPHTLEILEKQYMTSDIITLQEVSSSLIEMAKKGTIGKKFHVIAPSSMDVTRDQNSVVMLNKKSFPKGMEAEVTDLVKAAFPEGVDVPVADGDILAITTTALDKTQYVVASFHGDTNGLATKPVVDAIVQAMSKDADLSSRRLIFGMDANTYENAKPGKQQDVLDFADRYVSHGLSSCWGDRPNPSNYTTYNARTYLQPQLNKACKQAEKREKGDVNPKDFILFPKKHFDIVRTWKDNTGELKYIEDMAFPTLQFPSDHGILATVLEQK